jgi:shikimate dehydrogenase
MPRLGVLGWPVEHSRSPAMHNAALAALGMGEWSYQLLPVPPGLFEETARALPGSGFRGANVTIPHKVAALELADRASPAARAIGAANTLTFAADGAIEAENTDAPGLIEALDLPLAGRSALVLGAGGSARAAAWALREAGAREVSIWNRTRERARALAGELQVRFAERVEGADLLVNCTSVGLRPAPVGLRPTSVGVRAGESERAALRELELDEPTLGRFGCVADLAYRSGPTELITVAARLGARTVDGLEVLVAQGALSFELWTGEPAPREVMREAAREPAPGAA